MKHTSATEIAHIAHYVGKYVVCKHTSGLYAGKIVSTDTDTISLTDARRIWALVPSKGKWSAGAATHGIQPDSMVDAPVSLVQLPMPVEVFVTTSLAESTFREIGNCVRRTSLPKSRGEK